MHKLYLFEKKSKWFWLFNYLWVLLSACLNCHKHLPEHWKTSLCCPSVVQDLSWSCPKSAGRLLQDIKNILFSQIFLWKMIISFTRFIPELQERCSRVFLELFLNFLSCPKVVQVLSWLSWGQTCLSIRRSIPHALLGLKSALSGLKSTFSGLNSTLSGFES